MASNAEAPNPLYNILIFLCGGSYADGGVYSVVRILTRAQAEATYPMYVDAETGSIHEGRTHDWFFNVYMASSIGSHTLAEWEQLAAVHAEALQFEGSGGHAKEGYAEFAERFAALTEPAAERINAALAGGR